MKQQLISVKHRGKVLSATIVWPDDLREAVHLLGEFEVWRAFRAGYLELTKQRLIGQVTPRRKQYVKLDLSALDAQTADIVRGLAELQKPVGQVVQPSPETIPPAPSHTSQIDSAEKPTEAQDPIEKHADAFEEDFAKYLAARDS